MYRSGAENKYLFFSTNLKVLQNHVADFGCKKSAEVLEGVEEKLIWAGVPTALT